MARMLPELSEQQLRALKSRAEARFYEACRQQLEKDVLVIHAANWIYRDTRGRLREGEADFAIVSPSGGVLAVEVKGGGVAFDPRLNQWSSIDRAGIKHEIKDPFRQAARERFALLDQLSGDPKWRQWKGRRFTLGHAVVLPDIAEPKTLIGPDRPLEIIGASACLANLAEWVARAFGFWRRDDDDDLGSHGLKLVEEILCRAVEARPLLRTTIDDVERQRVVLTSNQAKILRIIGGRKRAVIAGGAGTGKTLIAIEKACRLAQTGLKTLFLCYNRPLAEALVSSLQGDPSLEILTFHQLCDRRGAAAKKIGRDVLAEAIAAYPGSTPQHRFDIQMPFALALSNEVLADKYDAVVVDEAQDFSDEYWFAIEELLANSTEGHLYIFIDQNQALYKRHGNLPVPDEPFYLTTNCRNTAPIHLAGYSFYEGEPVDPPEMQGPTVELVTVDGESAQAEAVARSVQQLLSRGGLRAEDVTTLVSKRPKDRMYELLSGYRLSGGTAWSFEAQRPRTVLVDTVARFKGLESQAVVLWLGEGSPEENGREILYVGTTRAKSVLIVIGSRTALAALANSPN